MTHKYILFKPSFFNRVQLLFLLVCAVSAFATAGPDQAPPTTTPAALPTLYIPVSGAVRFKNVYPFHMNSDTCVDPYQYIALQTDTAGWRQVLANRNRLRLWINGLCCKSVLPYALQQRDNLVIFQLIPDTAKRSAWKLFYTYPDYWKFHRTIAVELGTEDRLFRNAEPHTVVLHTTSLWKVITGYVLFGALLILLLWKAKGMLRDVGQYIGNGVALTKTLPTSITGSMINARDLPFSLARVQLFTWIMLVFLAILHIWAITGELAVPTGNVLLLLGISGGTFFVGKLIDKDQNTVSNTNQFVQNFQNDPQSKGLIVDILSDGQTISLHRLQFVIFTIFLAFYFGIHVMVHLSFPQIDGGMLALMGISSGMYAGIKTKETEPAPAPNPLAQAVNIPGGGHPDEH